MKAIPNGTRVVKTNSHLDDIHQDGAMAVVVDSIGPIPDVIKGKEMPQKLRGIYGYTVEWDDLPGVYVFIAGTRIKEAT